MDFEFSDRTKALQEKLNKFMDEVIYPAETVYEEQMEKAKDRWQLPPVMEEVKAEAKKRGLWNMFLPADRESGDTHGTMGLSNLEYAPLCEILGTDVPGPVTIDGQTLLGIEAGRIGLHLANIEECTHLPG